MPHLQLVPKQDVSSFRKIAIGTWREAKDPSVYGMLELPMDEALRYLEAYRAHTGKRLTVTHLVGKAVAAALAQMPDANAILRYQKIYLRKDISIFFQVAMTDEQTGQIDLSGVTIRAAHDKDLGAWVDDFEAAAVRVRTWKDAEKESTRRTFQRLPGFLVGPALDLVSFLLYTLNLNPKWFGLPYDAFGSAMITNVGSLGLEEAYVPLVPYSRVPLLLAMGATRKVPVVGDDDQIRVGHVMKLFATFDHRILDGVHAARMSKVLKAYFDKPFEHFDPIPDPALATGNASE
jgi:pyruvate/2-oxoglutarate dehydrogenase complex dihydrolipoamide acyltransferase (E2) component